MATLNTLRTRGGIIVSIVIGIALLAFLLGDLSRTDGMMRDRKMRVGEIDGNKIGYMEYKGQIDRYTRIIEAMSGKSSLSAAETDGIKDFAWEQLVNDYVLSPGFDKLGIAVSEAEQLDMIDGAYISPTVRSMFVNPQTGMYDPAMVRNLVSNMGSDPTGNAGAVWNYIKTQMDNERMMSKYISLVEQGMFITDLEVQQSVASLNTISDISYVMQDYSKVADSTVKVTDAEIKAYYEAHKNMFRQHASRDIEYVLVDVLPSAQDFADAEKTVNEMAVEFGASDDPLQYATLNSQTQNSKLYLGKNQMDPAMAEFAFGPNRKQMYGPLLSGTTYTMARVADVKMLPDSVGARHILLPATDAVRADSIVKALKAGADFAALANEFSLDKAANARGGELGIFMPEQMIPEFSNVLVQKNKGDIFTVTTQFGIHVVEMTYKSSMTEKVQLAEIVYKIEPSNTTQQDIYARVSSFVAAAAGSYDNFKKAASDEGLTPRAARVRATDRNVNGLDDSRELIRWAFTNEKGAVSPIMEIKGDYVIAAISDVSEDGIAPLKTVSSDIASILRIEKKGEMIGQTMTGSSLSEVASKLGLEIREAKDIDFNSFYVDGLGVEVKLVGAASVSPMNTLSKPVAGSAGVFVFDVTSRENMENVTPESEKVRLDATGKSYIGERLNQAIMENSNIKDMRVKFF